MKDKIYQLCSRDKQASRGFIKNRISIDERPQIVDDKTRIGDSEINLVIGIVVTIVERQGFSYHEEMKNA
jgi:IS30 family transposase